MSRQRTRQWQEERGLLLAGLVGLSGCLFYACGGDSGTSTTQGTGGSTGTESSTSVMGGTSSGSSTSTGGSTTGGAVDCVNDPSTAGNTAAVVAGVKALLAALTPEQQKAIQYEKTLANAEQWSNFPAGVVKRNGVRIGDMSAAAQSAVEALVQVAAGATGAKLLSEIRGADQAYAAISQNSTLFDSGNYYVSIHGTASTSSAWMLQIAGHHLAYNFTYGGKCTSATPLFDGVQPSTWTDANGTHAPLEPQRAATAALLMSVGSLSGAKLSGTFSDMINGPSPLGGDMPGGGMPDGGMPGGGTSGGNDSKYPSALIYPTGATGRGVNVGTFSADQKALVKTAIEAWVKNAADPVSSALLAVYESDDALAQTYVGYSGATDLSTNSSYARIDGPRVWIEFTVQEGTASNPQAHYHSIWRDKAADYGAEYISQ